MSVQMPDAAIDAFERALQMDPGKPHRLQPIEPMLLQVIALVDRSYCRAIRKYDRLQVL
jgi:hypothetical protein